MTPDNSQEIWQVEANGQVFDTTFVEMALWIDQGSLLRQDKVRKGNLRWIEAGKVPSLIAVFNAKDNGQPLPPVVTTTKLAPTALPGVRSEPPASAGGLSVGTNSTFGPPPYAGDGSHPGPETDPVCSMHADVPAAYVCGTCFSQFCKACPSSYGGSVKICPYCGAMCQSLAEVVETQASTTRHASFIGEGFGFSDFGRALAYPFKFKVSLVMGAIMFMLFSIGQSVAGFGGIFMMFSALVCFLMANTLTFGILATTTENFSQGKLDLNFMPTFEDFSIWDDVVHPFFLSIGVYISSFGPLLVMIIVAVFLVVSPAVKEMNGLQSDAARSVNPELPYAANAVKQSEVVRDLLNKQQQAAQKERIAAIENGQEPANISPAAPAVRDQSEETVARANEMIQQQRKAQLESAFGKTPETVAQEQKQLIARVLGYGVLFLLGGGLCLLWGLFYFPAACAVAGYTRSLGATLNPLVGLDTIKHLGVDYVKILVMGLLLLLASFMVGGILSIIFLPFNLPGMGNIPAKAIGSLFGFYLSVVFSCVIAYALYKAADRLKLAR